MLPGGFSRVSFDILYIMLEYYVKEQSFNDMQGGSKPRYIARLNEKSVLTTEELCERVSKACTLSKHEMLLAIGQMQDEAYSSASSAFSTRA